MHSMGYLVVYTWPTMLTNQLLVNQMICACVSSGMAMLDMQDNTPCLCLQLVCMKMPFPERAFGLGRARIHNA